MLTENINIIVHGAASVRFDDSLTSAVIANVRSTREIIKLAYDMKYLKAFIHISTAFSNCDKTIVDEKLYPPNGSWVEAIDLAENADEQILNFMTHKYIHPLPNTYTYTKSLAEHVVADMCTGKIPAAIFRPSIGKLF